MTQEKMWDKKKAEEFKPANDLKAIKQGKKDRKARRKALGCKFALAALLVCGTASSANAQSETCSTPPDLAVELTRGWCKDDAECVYLRMFRWLTCSENYDWQLSARAFYSQLQDCKKISSRKSELIHVLDRELRDYAQRNDRLTKQVRRMRKKLAGKR